jgi:vesicle-associated membrane protein 7
MVKNIDKVLERGEKLDILVDKTGDITDQSFTFKKNARRLKTAVFWANIKLIVAIVIVLVLVGIALFFYLCGGVKCFPQSGGGSSSPATDAPADTPTTAPK